MVEEILEFFQNKKWFRDRIEHIEEIPAKRARYAQEKIEFPAPIQDYLEKQNIKLYTHQYKTLKKEFPKCLTFLAVVVDKKIRYERVANRPGRSFDAAAIRERDRSEIENLEKGGPIVAADYYALNNGTAEEMTSRVDEILKEIDF